MSEQLYSIAYISQSLINQEGEDVRREINSILAVARARNEDQGVTGALLYSGGYFVQVLEGELDAIEEIFESIQCDRRHQSIQVLHHQPILRRSFPDWSMALSALRLELLPPVEALLVQVKDVPTRAGGEEVLKILESLLHRYEQMDTAPH